MIRGRRTAPPPITPDEPAAAAVIAPPGAGVFYITIGNTQVEAAVIPLGTSLDGVAFNVECVVVNAGDASLNWFSLIFGGTAGGWVTVPDGSPHELTPQEAEILTWRITVPAATAAGTYTLTAAFNAGAVTLTANCTLVVENAPVDPPTTLAPVTDLVAASGDASAFLTWTGASGAETYQIGQSTVDGGPYTVVQTVDASQNFASIEGLTNGTPYYFVVYSVAPGFTTSAASAQVTATPEDVDPTPGGDPPPVVTDVVVVAGDESAAVTWTASVGATSYLVVATPTPPTVALDVKVAVSEPITAAAIPDLLNGQEYTFTVYARNVSGTSAGVSAIGTPHAEGEGPGDPPLARELTATLFSITALDPAPTQAATANITPAPGVSLAGSSTFAQLGQLAKAGLDAQPAGYRMLHLGHVGYGRVDRAPMHDGVTPYTLVTAGLNTAGWVEGMLDFWEECDTRPEYVALDEESVASATYGGAYLIPFWLTLGPSAEARALRFAEIYEDDDVRKKLPYALRVSSVEELATITGTSADKVDLASAWDAYCLQRRAEALRRVVVDTWQETRGGTPPIVFNYDDERRVRKDTDGFNWPRVAGNRSVSSLSSPIFYIVSTYGGMPSYSKFFAKTKPERWCRFVDCINTMRSMRVGLMPWWSRLRYRNDGPGGVAPIYDANPDNARELYRHACEMGIREGVLFCPGITSGELAEWQQLVETTEVKVAPRRRLPPVDMEADSVTTGAHTTTYVEGEWA